MEQAVSFESVAKTYKPGFGPGVAAVRGVSFSVPAGCAFGLLGPNRAGKTTLVKILLSLARASSGAVLRLGRPASDRSTLARVGYMHENHAFPRYLGAREVLHLYAGLSEVPPAAIPAKAEALLTRVGLADRSSEPISRFSKGMVQRLGLAQALLNDPELLILDEPTEGLDLTGRQLLREVVRERKAAGKTVLLVSHVLSEVEELCDELAVVVAGELAYRGAAARLIGPAGPRRGSLEAALSGLYAKGAVA